MKRKTITISLAFIGILLLVIFANDILDSEIKFSKSSDENLKYQRKLERSGIPYTIKNFFKYTEEGDTGIIELFLKGGIFIDYKYESTGRSPTGKTAILIASEAGHLDAVKLLIEYGAKADGTGGHNYDGTTPLMLSAKNGHSDLVSYLISLGADVNNRNEFPGISAMMMASANGHIEVIQILLDNSADINLGSRPGKWYDRKDYKNTTALMYASSSGQTETVKFLLKNGAEVDIINKKGYTALSLAEEKDHTEIVNILENYNK